MALFTNLERFRKIFFSTFLNQCLIFGIQFASSILIVKSLDIPSYATYILFNTTLNLASNLSNLGLRSYLTRFVPGSNRDTAKSILWAVLLGQLITSIILILAFSPILGHPKWAWLERFQSDNLPFLFICFAGTLLISYAPRQFAGFFRYLDEDHKRANRVQIIAGTTFPIFLVGSWLILGSLSLTYVLIGMVVCQIISIILILILSQDMAGFPGTRPVLKELQSALSYSWPFAFLPIATQLIELGNRYFLAGYGTAVDLAKFSFNYGICNAGYTLIATSMGFTFFPEALRRFNQGKHKEAVLYNLKGVLACSLLEVIFFLCFWGISGSFFQLLGKGSLQLPFLPFMLICVSFLAQGLSNHGNFLLQAYNLRITNIGITIFGTVMSLILNYLLIPKYHVTGASIALASTAIVLLLFNLLPGILLKNKLVV